MMPLGSVLREVNYLENVVNPFSSGFIDIEYTLYQKRRDTIDTTIEDFDAEVHHVPNRMYDVDGELNETDDYGNVYMVDGRLLPETEYTLNGYTYRTDAYGRIVYCEGKPELNPENTRNPGAQSMAGGEGRRMDDQGGHIIARELDGNAGRGNLVAMDRRINQSDYKGMENEIKELLAEGKEVLVQIEISYDGDSERPSRITAEVDVDGVSTVYRFDNNLDGSLLKSIPENEREKAETKLDETNGQITSVREIYDGNDELKETVIKITYADENGNNHRISV